MQTGIIDRFEADYILVETDGAMREFLRANAPEGLREGMVVSIEGDRIIAVLEAETARRAAAIHSRFTRLKNRKKPQKEKD